jgi:DNA-binding response OmpR family regulator
MRKNLLLLPHSLALEVSHQFFRLDLGERPPRRVLMIEDDLSIATMYRIQLEADGFSVQHVVSGATGLHLAQTPPPPDLVLLDVRLPQLGGLDVLRRMAGDPRLAQVPVLILSNYSDAGIVREGLALGAREYLVKSQTTPAELVARIRQHLPHTD